MDEQRAEQIVDILHDYFDRADPDDDAHNARVIQDNLKRYSSELLLLAPPVIIDGLRNAVEAQLKQQLFLGADDETLDRRLKEVGLSLLMKYASLLRLAGGSSVMALIFSLPMFLNQDEDVVTINAYTLGTLARSRSAQIATAVTSATHLLSDVFQQAYNTGCKIALAYALFECNQREQFKSYAVPRLAQPQQRRALEQLVNPGNMSLRAWVVGALVMDIASNGSAFGSEAGWQRRR